MEARNCGSRFAELVEWGEVHGFSRWSIMLPGDNHFVAPPQVLQMELALWHPWTRCAANHCVPALASELELEWLCGEQQVLLPPSSEFQQVSLPSQVVKVVPDARIHWRLIRQSNQVANLASCCCFLSCTETVERMDELGRKSFKGNDRQSRRQL